MNTFEQIRKAARGMLPERGAPTNSGEGWPATAARRVRPIVTRLSAGPDDLLGRVKYVEQKLGIESGK